MIRSRASTPASSGAGRGGIRGRPVLAARADTLALAACYGPVRLIARNSFSHDSRSRNRGHAGRLDSHSANRAPPRSGECRAAVPRRPGSGSPWCRPAGLYAVRRYASVDDRWFLLTYTFAYVGAPEVRRLVPGGHSRIARKRGLLEGMPRQGGEVLAGGRFPSSTTPLGFENWVVLEPQHAGALRVHQADESPDLCRRLPARVRSRRRFPRRGAIRRGASGAGTRSPGHGQGRDG